MRKLLVDGWIGRDLEALKYFSQLVEDFLYDYTLSSYKVKLMNTHSLCGELIHFFPLIHEKIISKGAQIPIIEELLQSLERDFIVQKILGELYKPFFEKINSNQNDIKLIESTINLLNSILNEKYLTEIHQNIEKIVVNNEHNEKKKLRFLTQTYLTELISNGFSKRYIYFTNNSFFFNEQRKVNSVRSFYEFTKCFSLTLHKYSILIELDKVDWVAGAVKGSNIVIHNKIPESYGLDFNYSGVFIEFNDIKALDPHTAREFAERNLSVFESWVNFYHHKKRLLMKGPVFVKQDNMTKAWTITENVQSIFKQPDKSENYIGENTKKIFQVIDRLNFELIPLLKTHADALRTDNPNQQFVSIWSALDHVISRVSKNKNIENIVTTFLPFFSLNYFIKYLSFIINYMNNQYDYLFSKLLESIVEGGNKFEKSVLLLTSKKYEKLRMAELYPNILNENPILVNKIAHIINMVKDKKEMRKAINKHLKYIKWQFHRIYRTRNIIIHDAQTVSYLNNLIENLHEYFDWIIETIIRYSENNPSVTSINEIFTGIEIESKYYLNLLDKDNEELSLSNYKRLLLHEY